MQIDAQHWLTRTVRIPSPNCDARPDPSDVSLLVLHNISLPAGRFGTGHVEALFCNRLDCSLHPSYSDLEGLNVSAHLFIRRRGQVIQFVPFDLRAWHAGDSNWRGRRRCNDFAIGIELEGTDERAYTRSQYRKLAALTQVLQQRYPRLAADAIVGHQDIAPGRKTDPGPAFDWARYFALLRGGANA